MIQTQIELKTNGRGLYRIDLDRYFKQNEISLPPIGFVNAFIQHTSASLIIQENADPSAKKDLEIFLDRLIPDGQNWHSHTLEGPDDTTAHMKSSITQTSMIIPVADSQLALGRWQCLYLWEHRQAPNMRRILLTVYP